MQSVEVLRHKTQTAMLLSCKHYVLMICLNKPICDHQTCKKKIKFRIFRFCPIFDMLYLNVYLVQKCKKHLCCNLFWVRTQFDWTNTIICLIKLHRTISYMAWTLILITPLLPNYIGKTGYQHVSLLLEKKPEIP